MLPLGAQTLPPRNPARSRFGPDPDFVPSARDDWRILVAIRTGSATDRPPADNAWRIVVAIRPNPDFTSLDHDGWRIGAIQDSDAPPAAPGNTESPPNPAAPTRNSDAPPAAPGTKNRPESRGAIQDSDAPPAAPGNTESPPNPAAPTRNSDAPPAAPGNTESPPNPAAPTRNSDAPPADAPGPASPAAPIPSIPIFPKNQDVPHHREANPNTTHPAPQTDPDPGDFRQSAFAR
jgi:hypothetical protein